MRRFGVRAKEGESLGVADGESLVVVDVDANIRDGYLGRITLRK